MDHYSGVGETPRQNAYRNIQGASRDASPVHGGRDGPDKSVRYTRKFSFRSPIHIQTGYPFRIEHPGEFRSIHFRYTSSLTRGHKTTVIHLYHSRRSIFLIISSTSADADVLEVLSPGYFVTFSTSEMALSKEAFGKAPMAI